MSDVTKLVELKQKANRLPLTPGVYIMKDKNDNIIYIGKAKSLKNRVTQYFGSGSGHNEKVRKMVSFVDHFEYVPANLRRSYLKTHLLSKINLNITFYLMMIKVITILK